MRTRKVGFADRTVDVRITKSLTPDSTYMSCQVESSPLVWSAFCVASANGGGRGGYHVGVLQGNLAHKKAPTPLGPILGP